MSENGEIKKEYFMASVPLFVIASYYLMQSALKKETLTFFSSTSSWITIILSLVLLVFAINLIFCSFIGRPAKWVSTTYQISSFFGIIASLVFTIDWVKALTDLINLKADPWYVYIFFSVGFLLIFGIFIFYAYSMLRASRTKSQ